MLVLVSYVDGEERARREVVSEHAARRTAARIQAMCTPYNVFPRFELRAPEGTLIMASATTGGRIRWRRSVEGGGKQQGAAVAEGSAGVGIPNEYLASGPDPLLREAAELEDYLG